MVMVGRLVRSALSVGLLAGVLVVLPVVGPVPEAGAAPAVVGGSCSSPGPHGFGDVPAGSYYEVAVTSRTVTAEARVPQILEHGDGERAACDVRRRSSHRPRARCCP